MWCNFTLTDAAMHEGGPHSEMAAASVRDSDGRVGAILDALEQRGVIDDCAFVLVADHGMEENDPTCRGDWDVALRAAGRRGPRRGVQLPVPRSLTSSRPDVRTACASRFVGVAVPRASARVARCSHGVRR